MPRVTVEHGGHFIHCGASQVREVLRQLRDVSPEHDVLKVCCQLPAVVGWLKACVDRIGHESFSMALRACQVRDQLGRSTVRGTPLLRVLEWVGAAADAQRHLVPALVLEAEKAVAANLAQGVRRYGCEGRARV